MQPKYPTRQHADPMRDTHPARPQTVFPTDRAGEDGINRHPDRHDCDSRAIKTASSDTTTVVHIPRYAATAAYHEEASRGTPRLRHITKRRHKITTASAHLVRHHP